VAADQHIAGITITTARGPAIRAFLPALAALRVKVFREWPYLYEGCAEYEAAYLAKYAAAEGALAVIATDDASGMIVGASTALPLPAAEEELASPFRAAGLDPAAYYYFAESVLEAAWRGRGIGVAFFAEREAEAQRLGFATATFSAVQRAADHPLRPANHVPLDMFWRRRGYTPHPDLIATLAWRDVGAPADSDKPMMFWSRRLPPPDATAS
jgi:GNAT superfamily N-acetyltransferase